MFYLTSKFAQIFLFLTKNLQTWITFFAHEAFQGEGDRPLGRDGEAAVKLDGDGVGPFTFDNMHLSLLKTKRRRVRGYHRGDALGPFAVL